MRRAVVRMRQKAAALRQQSDRDHSPLSAVLEQIRRDPETTMRLSGLTPDRWQTALLRSSADQVLVLTARQCGKSTAVAALALNTALLRSQSLVLLLSPS